MSESATEGTAGSRARQAVRPARSWLRLAAGLLLGPAAAACNASPPRELADLVVRDSTYLDSETLTPYTGPVVHHFAAAAPSDEDAESAPERRRQLEATLRDGAWEGELTVYHPTGRIRYQGEMRAGARCGAWTENENADEPETVYEAIREDLESLVIYPDCPEG